MEPMSPPLPFTARHADGLAGEGVGQIDLGTGVAAAEVGDAQVGAQQIGTVAQECELVVAEGSRLALVPQIF